MAVNELKSRRFAGDFTNLAQFYLESERYPSPIPNYDKDLPRIPSTSTELCGDEVVTVFTNLSGDLTTSPVVGCSPFRGPSHDEGGRVPMTEAQKIAAQYRQRRSRSSESPSSSKRSTLGTYSHPLYAPLPEHRDTIRWLCRWPSYERCYRSFDSASNKAGPRR